VSDLLRRPYVPTADGWSITAPAGPAIQTVQPDGSWKYVSFHVVRIPPGTSTGFEARDHELCAVVIEGECDLRSYVERRGEWTPIGGRRDPFDGPPVAHYAPPPAKVLVRSARGAEIAVGMAKAAGGLQPRALPASEVRREVRGSAAMERTIHHILMEDQPASSLLVTEVVTPAGHWSSYPPHKHDTDDPPRESLLEEVYYFRFKDPRGFGLMRVYTADPGVGAPVRGARLDESIAVRDRDLVLVPRGYHTFSAAPGYDAYYLNVMAGPRREWKITFDPDHERMRW
jgi:5-deoxy-glucuronate isomerase